MAGSRRAVRALVVLIAVAVASVAVPASARADNVDILIRDVKGGSDYKVRLSAVLALAKLADARGVSALAGALADRDKTVRGAAAVALGKLITSSTPATTRAQIKKALETLVARESADSVKKLAQRTLSKLEALEAGNAGVSGTIYVEVDKMASKVEPATDLRELMRKTAQTTLSRKAKDFMQTWPGGKSPSKKELTARRVAGFYLDGTVNELAVKQKGAAATVSCKINMLIATYPEKSIFGMLSGTASVAGSNDARDIELAKQDCITAVVEDLVNTKVVPTIRTKAAQ